MTGRNTLSMRAGLAASCVAALTGLAAVWPAKAWGAAAAAPPETVMIAAELSGAQVVGTPADTDGSGRFAATLATRTRQLCYEIEVRLIGQASAASIYAGRSGAPSGAGLVGLAVPDARGRASGCVALTKQAARFLAANPAGAHVSIHNPLYPAGALRGQLAAGGPGAAVAEQADPVRVPSDVPADPGPPREGRKRSGPVFTGT